MKEREREFNPIYRVRFGIVIENIRRRVLSFYFFGVVVIGVVAKQEYEMETQKKKKRHPYFILHTITLLK